MHVLVLLGYLLVQGYEYPGPPMGTWRDPCAYGPGPDCPGTRHREPVPLPRPRPHYGPNMEDCIYNGYCGPQEEPVPNVPPPCYPYC